MYLNVDVLPGNLVLSLVEPGVVDGVVDVDGQHLRGRDVQVGQVDLFVRALILQLLKQKL